MYRFIPLALLLVMAAGDHEKFRASPDLKKWTHWSDFGQGLGAHGGVVPAQRWRSAMTLPRIRL